MTFLTRENIKTRFLVVLPIRLGLLIKNMAKRSFCTEEEIQSICLLSQFLTNATILEK